jgi:hypothetical protein
MPKSGDLVHRDLHPFVDASVSTIEFHVISRGRRVRVDVPRETVSQSFGVTDSRYGLLEAYEAHRDQIDAAVICRAAEGGTGVVVVRPMDLH